MGVLKTLAAVLFVLPFHAVAQIDLAREFANCTGRYSAELEHAWLIGNPEADELARRRELFEQMLDAVAPPASAADMLNLRVEAKFAHARMLSLADFSQKDADAAWARRRASIEIGYCASLILES